MSSKPTVVIIGAEVGGLAFAITLKRRLGFEQFTIFEKASEIGGTWRANIYPGSSSDVPIHWYSLSTELRPSWKKSHGLQPEIQAYWIELAEKHDLYSHIMLSTKVVSATWDPAKQLYEVLYEEIASGTRHSTTAHIVISAVGILEIPKIPYEIEGVSTFKGESFHSADWRNDVEFHNKRVAVVGNASSAAQFVPAISEDSTTEVVNFIRTPSWFNTRPHIPYTDTQKWVFANVPFAMKLHRSLIAFEMDAPVLLPRSERARKARVENMTKYILDHTPRKYHDKIIPTYPPGCKRIIADSGYLASFYRPNVNLNFDGIAKILENGILTTKGEVIPFDVIIYATGFIGDNYPVDVRGMDGTSIREYYDRMGGPTAYLGTALPGFPNFYMMTGPNTGTHASTLFVEEVQIDYCLQLIKPVLDGLVSSFQVTSEATYIYNKRLEKRLTDSVYSQCSSWQRVDGTGKIYNPFPGPTFLYWWWLRQPNWDHYKAVNAGRWLRQRYLHMLYGTIKAFGLIVCLWAYRMQRRALLKVLETYYRKLLTKIQPILLGVKR
ncbi:hypothetical protein SERLA73DRAFT_74465 [Serpula lacrymans var. lacrymans S7.3]|uniref:FAD/NAD(P)-binding domain-containing protein n=1 Tax=Serpula lacrymans var. lacrymans (strain S7.3) TaxID=936435 RepID=F8Q1Q9_SERL3|nr:hypothetical protein SERLA73DRAFT_74465 [Serpula lacrymans var. lacrymans S7.3]